MRQQGLTVAGCLVLAVMMAVSGYTGPAYAAHHTGHTAMAAASEGACHTVAKDASCGKGACPKKAEGKACCDKFVDVNKDGACDNCATGTCCAAKQQAKAGDGCPCPTCSTSGSNGKCKDFVDADRNGACDHCVAGVCKSRADSQAKKDAAKTEAGCPLHSK